MSCQISLQTVNINVVSNQKCTCVFVRKLKLVQTQKEKLVEYAQFFPQTFNWNAESIK